VTVRGDTSNYTNLDFDSKPIKKTYTTGSSLKVLLNFMKVGMTLSPVSSSLIVARASRLKNPNSTSS